MNLKHSAVPAPVSAYTLCENTLCRRMRVGACPVLTAKALYPALMPTDREAPQGRVLYATEAAAERFNTCYAQAAETFVTGCLDRMGADAEATYLALPEDGRYLFSRRTVTCSMTPAENASDPDGLSVEISKSDGRGRGRDTVTCAVAEHIWRFPHGTLQSSAQRSPKISKKL